MKKTESENSLIRKDASALINSKSSLDKPFERYQEKKRNYLIDSLASQLSNFPMLLEEVSKNKAVALDISKELAQKIADGELEFVRNRSTEKAVGILRDSKTKKLFSQIPIKEMPLNLGTTIAIIGLTNQIQDISRKLDVLENKLNQVNRNFDLNRYAEVQSSIEKYKIALLSKNPETKKVLLQESLSQATNAKNQLLNQLFEAKEQLKNQKNKFNIPIINDGLSANDSAKLAQIALDNLSYMKDAFNIQISSLMELEEYDALDYVVTDFQGIILNNFSNQEALFLDGNLPVSTNPFKYLSKNVVETTQSISDYINSNHDLLDANFSFDSLQNSSSSEVTNYES